MSYKYNYKMANKGRSFEELIDYQNTLYYNKGLSTVQKIPTPWVVTRRYGKIVDAHPDKKSTVDYRGAVKLLDGKAYPVSFEAKETIETDGLPLRNIHEHQINFLKTALNVGEIAFVICYLTAFNKCYFIDGEFVIRKYQLWQQNKRKWGYNLIPISDMTEIENRPGNICDFINILNRFYLRE